MSPRKFLIAALALCAATPSLAQSIQLGAGQIIGNSTAAARPGRAENVTSVFDRAFASTRGSVLERGAGGWVAVVPGTAGLAWVSAGAGADPAYGLVGLNGGGCNAALTASNGGILYSTASACAILAGTATARLPLLSGASTTPVWGAFTLPASVTSGGVPYFSSTSVMGSSGALTANTVVIGGGAGNPPTSIGTGTTATVLHGNAGGAPSYSSIALGSEVTGQLPIANGGTGQATAATAITALMPTPTRAGDVAYWNGSNWTTLAGNNSGTQVLSENSSGVPAWAAAGSGTVTSAVIATGAGITVSGTCTITTTGTCTVAQSLTNATKQATHGSPTGTSSASPLMMGAGTTCFLTPTYGTRVLLTFQGDITSASAVSGTIQPRFGTGTAPANAAASTGTAVGGGGDVTISTASGFAPLSYGGIITGLTPGTAYWFDVSLSTGSGSVVSLTRLACSIMEF